MCETSGCGSIAAPSLTYWPLIIRQTWLSRRVPDWHSTEQPCSPSRVLHQQQDDLINFGKLLLALCFGSTAAVHNPAASMDIVSQNYSPDVKLVIMYLLGKPGPGKCIDDILVMLGPRLLNEFDAMQKWVLRGSGRLRRF